MAHTKTALIARDKKYIWHPFTQMRDWVRDDPSPPLIIRSGRGNYLYDIDGNRYFDGVSSLWVTLHGHKKKELDSAIKKQLRKVAHSTFLGLTHEPAVILAEKLVKIAPEGLARVFYSDNGSTAVEVALKMAYQYWQFKGKPKKKKFLSLINAYHGDTIGSVSVGGMDMFHARFRGLLFKGYYAPSPYCFRCKTTKTPSFASRRSYLAGEQRDTRYEILFGNHCKLMGCKGDCLKDAERILAQHNKEIAAAIIEPMVQGAAGMLTMPPGYMKAFERLCRKYNVLLICDEVATGFGRTGKMFACEYEDIKPDLMCVAKGITGGYLPLAATLASENIYKAFLGRYEEFKTFFHGHTYTANPLACAAAIANLEIFERERTLERLKTTITNYRLQITNLEKMPNVGEVRQIGLMAAIEIVKDKKTKEIYPAKLKIPAKICIACRPLGLIIRPLDNNIILMPPLSTTVSEVSKIIKIIAQAIEEVLQ
ncbi:MAG: adenosylmethionine--8-amino-7-oxononanoate transaminase [Elusimicrobiota bacterium]